MLGERHRERFALRQEPVTRMHGFSSGLLAGVDDLIDDQIAFRRGSRSDVNGFVSHFDMQRIPVGIRVNRDRLDAHFAGSLDDAAGDLATVGNQDFLEHGVAVIWR